MTGGRYKVILLHATLVSVGHAWAQRTVDARASSAAHRFFFFFWSPPQAPVKRRYSEPLARKKVGRSKVTGRHPMMSVKNCRTQPKINTFVIKD